MQRHVDGETIADIARSYHCTAPAIRYIVRRSAAAAAGASDQAIPVKAKPPSPTAERPETAFRTASAGERAVGRLPQGDLAAPRRLSRELVRKANGDIAAFIVALNAADTNLDIQTLEDLRDATDRLLQSCARTRLEIERIFPFSAQEQPGGLSNESVGSQDAGGRPGSSLRS